MTEPEVASSDATNIVTKIERVGDEYLVSGRKWWSSEVKGALTRFPLRPGLLVFLIANRTTDGEAHLSDGIGAIGAPGIGLEVRGCQLGQNQCHHRWVGRHSRR
jgi:acyl-CoA dehydrogenase